MTIFASCPDCGKSLRVVVGRKSDTRQARCCCGSRFDYSAWQLKKPRAGETVGLHSFYQVDLFKVTT